jgi:hypothetical protein
LILFKDQKEKDVKKMKKRGEPKKYRCRRGGVAPDNPKAKYLRGINALTYFAGKTYGDQIFLLKYLVRANPSAKHDCPNSSSEEQTDMTELFDALIERKKQVEGLENMQILIAGNLEGFTWDKLYLSEEQIRKNPNITYWPLDTVPIWVLWHDSWEKMMALRINLQKYYPKSKSGPYDDDTSANIRSGIELVIEWFEETREKASAIPKSERTFDKLLRDSEVQKVMDDFNNADMPQARKLPIQRAMEKELGLLKKEWNDFEKEWDSLGIHSIRVLSELLELENGPEFTQEVNRIITTGEIHFTPGQVFHRLNAIGAIYFIFTEEGNDPCLATVLMREEVYDIVLRIFLEELQNEQQELIGDPGEPNPDVKCLPWQDLRWPWFQRESESKTTKPLSSPAEQKTSWTFPSISLPSLPSLSLPSMPSSLLPNVSLAIGPTPKPTPKPAVSVMGPAVIGPAVMGPTVMGPAVPVPVPVPVSKMPKPSPTPPTQSSSEPEIKTQRPPPPQPWVIPNMHQFFGPVPDTRFKYYDGPMYRPPPFTALVAHRGNPCYPNSGLLSIPTPTHESKKEIKQKKVKKVKAHALTFGWFNEERAKKGR